MVALEHFCFGNSRSQAITISFSEICSFDKVQKRVAKEALIIVLNVYYCFLLVNKSGKGCQPRRSSGAYFTLFKVICNTLARQRQDLSRMNFVLNFSIRSGEIRMESI